MKKLFLVLTFLCCFCAVSTAQNMAPRSDFWGNVRYGGGLALGFGNRTFNIALAPSAIYQVSPQFAAGLGLSFNYSEFDTSKFTAFGGSIVSYFNPIPSMQLSAEFEQIRVNREDQILGEVITDSYWTPALFLGVGFGNRNVMGGLRYDVLYRDDRSIYVNALMPFVRVYF